MSTVSAWGDIYLHYHSFKMFKDLVSGSCGRSALMTDTVKGLQGEYNLRNIKKQFDRGAVPKQLKLNIDIVENHLH